MLYRHAPMSRSIPKLRKRANPSSNTTLALTRSPVPLMALPRLTSVWAVPIGSAN